MPNPRNASPDSVSIMPAKLSVALTMIVEITFGTICLKTILLSFTPMALAAVTYSCSRPRSTSARTRTHKPVQPTTPSTIMTRYIF